MFTGTISMNWSIAIARCYWRLCGRRWRGNNPLRPSATSPKYDDENLGYVFKVHLVVFGGGREGALFCQTDIKVKTSEFLPPMGMLRKKLGSLLIKQPLVE